MLKCGEERLLKTAWYSNEGVLKKAYFRNYKRK